MKINYSFHSDNWDIVPARMDSIMYLSIVKSMYHIYTSIHIHNAYKPVRHSPNQTEGSFSVGRVFS